MSKKPRVLILLTDLLIGGVPTIVREVALEMHRQGVDVQVAGLAPWGPMADQIRDGGVPVTALGACSIRDAGVFERLVKLIRREEIDTVLSYLMHANVAAVYAKLRCRHLRIFQSIQTTQSYPWWHWKAQGLIQRWVDRFIVPSQSVVEVAHKWSGISPSCVEVVPNPVDVRQLCGVVPQSFGQHPLPVGFIGRLDPIKRLPDLLEATKLLGGRIHLHVFGAGEQEAAVRRRIAELGIEASVTMHGAVPSARRALPSMAVLVLPSTAEGFGIVLVEAMAAGVAVVATNVPGIRDVVTHEETGLLVPVGSPQAIAEAITRLTNEPELRDRLVIAGKGLAKRKYGTPEVVGEYRRIMGV